MEARVALLGHRVVESASRVPVSMKFRNTHDKWLLWQLLHRYLSQQLTGPPKMGFGIPIDSWLRVPLRSRAESLLSAARLTQDGYFAAGPTRSKRDENLCGHRDEAYDT